MSFFPGFSQCQLSASVGKIRASLSGLRTTLLNA